MVETGRRIMGDRGTHGEKTSVNIVHISVILTAGHILLKVQNVVRRAAWLEDPTQHLIISEPIQHCLVLING